MNMTSNSETNLPRSASSVGKRLAGLWRNLSLARKLFISFSALALLAVLVGIVARIGLNTMQSSYQHALSDGGEMQRISQQLSNDLLTARRAEKDFLLRWQEEGFDTAYTNYVVVNKAAVAAMSGHVDELSGFTRTVENTLGLAYPRSQYSGDLNVLRRSIVLYKESFLQTVQLIQEKGSQDTGLEGEFRAAVHKIEERIYGREGLDPLVITMLQIRRREKDYLLRADQEYVDNVHQLVAELKKQIASSDQLSPAEKMEMRTLADEYVAAFDGLVEKNAEIAESIEAFRRAAHAMEPVADRLANAGAEMSRIDIAAAEKSSSQTLINASITLVAVLFIAVFLAITLSRQITRPIYQLTHAAHELESGNYDAEAEVATSDELGILAGAFNNMARNLKQSVALVTKRATELQSVAEIATKASRTTDVQNMLQSVVDLTKSNYKLYHAHIYLLDDAGVNLVLAAGAGEAGRQMVSEKRKIALDHQHSLVARAARTTRGAISNDVTREPDFLRNPLLPDTRSELAVPMMVGDQVIGVFDVQSEVAGRFTDADIAVQTTLASQVASAVQNARSYTEIQRSQEQLAEALKISRLGNWEYDVQKDLFTFNDQFYSMFRTTAEKVGGYRLSSADYARLFVHPDDAPLVGLEIQKTLANRDRRFSASLEHRIIFSDGEIGYITVSINVERDENGNVLRWYGANQDVTERRQLEEINRKRAIQQETINTITQRIQSATTIESALQIAARELGHALGGRETQVALERSALHNTASSVVTE